MEPETNANEPPVYVSPSMRHEPKRTSIVRDHYATYRWKLYPKKLYGLHYGPAPGTTIHHTSRSVEWMQRSRPPSPAPMEVLNGCNGHPLLNGCNGHPLLNGCNGHPLLNGCNGHPLLNGCNGHPLLNGCNGHAPHPQPLRGA